MKKFLTSNKLEINSDIANFEKRLSKNKIKDIINTNSLIDYQIKMKKNDIKTNKRKKDYIISIDNAFNKIKEKVRLKQSKLLNQTKLAEISNIKNISKEKTMNNTFNTNNTNNTYSNINNNMNQNSNSNNTYINVAINNITEDDKSKNSELLNDINKIEKHTPKKIEQIDLNNLNMNNFSENNKINKIRIPREYYTEKDQIAELNKIRQDLFNSSRKFYLHNSNKTIINRLRQLKSKNIERELKQLGYDFNNKKKFNLYSELKRLPTQICFGKGVSSMKEEKEDKEIYENKFLKNLENKSKENQTNKDNYYKLLTKGFCGSKKNINKYDAVFENKLVVNSNSMKKYEQKNQLITGQNMYPLFKQKKILRNILPKEVDYNTQFTINDVIDDEMHPLYRYQKKNLTFHSGLISHEIDFLFVKHFALGEMVDKKKDVLNKKKDEKFDILIKLLIGKKSDMRDEEKKLTDRAKQKLIRRKYLLKKFENAIKKSFYQFRRMKIDIRTFLNITRYDIPISDSDGMYLFKAIKDGDIENIERLIKKNYNYALFRDEFGQTAFHICAKRNIYQIVLLLISRLGDIDAKDIHGRTPLMRAVEYGNLETISVLLFNYADPNIEDNEGKKAIDLLRFNKNSENAIEYKIERALKYARLVHLFNRMMVNEKDFDTFVKNSLKYLFKEELNINFEELLKTNTEVLKDDDKKYKK